MKSLGFRFLWVYIFISLMLVLTITAMLSLGYIRLQWENMQFKADAIARDILRAGGVSPELNTETLTSGTGPNMRDAVEKLRSTLVQNTEGFLIVSAAGGLIASSGASMQDLIPDREQIERIHFSRRYSGEPYVRKSGLLEYIFYAPLDTPAFADSLLIFVIDFSRRSGAGWKPGYYPFVIPVVIIIFQLILGFFLYRRGVLPVYRLRDTIKQMEQGCFDQESNGDIREINEILTTLTRIYLRDPKEQVVPPETSGLRAVASDESSRESDLKARTANFFSRQMDDFSLSIFYNGPIEIKRYCKSFTPAGTVKALIFWGVEEQKGAQGIITIKITALIKNWLRENDPQEECDQQVKDWLEQLRHTLSSLHCKGEKLAYLLVAVLDTNNRQLYASSLGEFRLFTGKKDLGIVQNPLPGSDSSPAVLKAKLKVKKIPIPRQELFLVMNRELNSFVVKKTGFIKELRKLLAQNQIEEPEALLHTIRDNLHLNTPDLIKQVKKEEFYCTLIKIG